MTTSSTDEDLALLANKDAWQDIGRRKKQLHRKLLADGSKRTEKKVAILGGSTTAELTNNLEIFLLSCGIKPEFYESDYNRYYEEAVFDSQALETFGPDIIYIHTSWVNIPFFPHIQDTEEQMVSLVEDHFQKFKTIWTSLLQKTSATILQNNFDYIPYRDLQSLDTIDHRGRNRMVLELNQKFAAFALGEPRIVINDIHYLSAQVGLNRWFDSGEWYAYKQGVSVAATPILANQVARLMVALWGKSKKTLVLDLDNTLWGGVIGDDGIQGLKLGKDSTLGEAHHDFQSYIKRLSERGVVLSVSSKNEHAIAKEGFTHPDSVLKFEDFAAFKANWEPKHLNIVETSHELNLGLDSMVFVDDNPAERALVSSQLPAVSVPAMGADVARYIEILDAHHFFEPIRISADDQKRREYYAANLQRGELRSHFKDYGEFLASLEMIAEIKPFSEIYLERITQLINKTNQFNLTTRRYTFAEVKHRVGNQEEFITLYGKLTDKFGDNGLVSVVIGAIQGKKLEIETWLMSCRVLKRHMELAMFDELVRQSLARGIDTLVGTYLPTGRNEMVREHFSGLGFHIVEKLETKETSGGSRWAMSLDSARGFWENKNKFIKVTTHD